MQQANVQHRREAVRRMNEVTSARLIEIRGLGKGPSPWELLEATKNWRETKNR